MKSILFTVILLYFWGKLVFCENYQLVPHFYKRIEEVYDLTTAESVLHCAAKCSTEEICKAVNFRLSTGDCQLSAVCFDYFKGNDISDDDWIAITWKDYPDCPTPAPPHNGWLGYSCGARGAVAHVNCFSSHVLCGWNTCAKSTITCQSDGFWENFPYCMTARQGVVTLNDEWGTIMSPNYPNTYSDYDVREWVIYVPNAEKLILSFHHMETEENYDTIKVHDGCDETAPILGIFSGLTIPEPLTSCGSSLYVNFTADFSNVLSGFQASWRVV